jgi:hypothetical protein
LTSAQVVELTTAQIAQLSGDKLNLLTNFASLETRDIAAIPATNFSGLNSAQLANLSTAQAAAITSSQIAYLSTAQIVNLDAQDFGALNTSTFSTIAFAYAQRSRTPPPWTTQPPKTHYMALNINAA